jgi:hypothetical protein
MTERAGEGANVEGEWKTVVARDVAMFASLIPTNYVTFRIRIQ